MDCSNCGFDNPDEMKFCGECGTALKNLCSQCGFDNPPRFKFCGECGTSLAGEMAMPIPVQEEPQTQVQPPPTEPHTPDAERRQLTVMFCDLVGSTELSGQMDAEDYRAVVRDYQKTCTEVIKRFDGYVAQYLGDGLLVYFGYPQSHEDEAQRAVYTGLGIFDAMTQLNARLEQDEGTRLAVRVGIHTGLVVIGEIGEGNRQEQLALGEVPNVAARIQGFAEPDSVVISEATCRLILGYFDCQELGEQTLRGVSEPMAVYQVLQASGIQSRLEAVGTRGLTPLIGREQEIGLLLDRWEQAKESQGQVVLLSGEAGIGKSRLVQALKDHIAEGVHTRLECRSSPYFTNSALYPIIDMVQRTLQFQADDSPEQKLEKLEQNLSQYRLPLEESVPLFAELLSLSVSEDQYPPLNISPQLQRQKTLEAIVAITLELSERQPVLFILEDLHWTDPSTLEFIELLIEQTPTASLCLLLTSRPEFQVQWTNHSYFAQVTLNRLSGNSIEQIATGVTGGKSLPHEVLQQLVEKTDGVPLYVEEMTKSALESGYLKATNGHYELTGSIGSLSIPATLQDSLMARLDRLVTAKAVAQYAAVIGRQFSYELLQAVSGLDEATLQRELGRLVEAELVYQRGLPPQATYAFKHALVQDTAYESLLRSTKQQYHRRIVEALEERFSETAETQPELLAHHYTAAGFHSQAVNLWQQAGAQAITRSAYQEAVGCYEQALHALQHLPDTQTIREHAIDVRLALRGAHHVRGEFEKILPYLREAASLAETLDDPHRLGRALSHMASYFTNTDQPHQALEPAKRALTLAESSQDFGLQVANRFRVAQIHRDLGAYHQAIALLEANINALSGDLQYETFGQASASLAVTSRHNLIQCHNAVGQFTESKRLQAEAVEIAETMQHPISLAFAYGPASSVSVMQGDVQQAIPLLERSRMLCQMHHITVTYLPTLVFLSLAYALAQRDAEARQLLDDVMPRRTSLLRPFRPALIETLFLTGRVEDALTDATETLDRYPPEQSKGFRAETFRLLGDIHAYQNPDDVETSETHYQQSLVLANALGMRPVQAHCHRGLGKLYSQAEQPEQARTELSTAIEMYRDMEMTFWVPETEAALAAVEGR